MLARSLVQSVSGVACLSVPLATSPQVSEDTVQPVLNAANFLGVPPIVDACCQVQPCHGIVHIQRMKCANIDGIGVHMRMHLREQVRPTVLLTAVLAEEAAAGHMPGHHTACRKACAA